MILVSGIMATSSNAILDESKDVEERTSYTKEEVKEMDPLTVLEEFVRMTGITSLGCRCCGGKYRKETYVWDNWVNSIYTRALKSGLSAGIKPPASCDKQQARNNKTNKVNNMAYRVLHSDKYDDKTKKEMLVLRQSVLQEMGVATRPHHYKV